MSYVVEKKFDNLRNAMNNWSKLYSKLFTPTTNYSFFFMFSPTINIYHDSINQSILIHLILIINYPLVKKWDLNRECDHPKIL